MHVYRLDQGVRTTQKLRRRTRTWDECGIKREREVGQRGDFRIQWEDDIENRE